MNPRPESTASSTCTLRVRTLCTATVEEVWTLSVSPVVAARAAACAEEALSLLTSDGVVSVENTDIRGEVDRVVLDVSLGHPESRRENHPRSAPPTAIEQ
jgi:hypothetical protein